MNFNMKCLFKNIALVAMLLSLSIAESNSQPQSTTVSIGGVDAVQAGPADPDSVEMVCRADQRPVEIEQTGFIAAGHDIRFC